MPTSPLVRMLNRPDVVTDADLTSSAATSPATAFSAASRRWRRTCITATTTISSSTRRRCSAASSAPRHQVLDRHRRRGHAFQLLRAPDTARRLLAASTGRRASSRTLEAAVGGDHGRLRKRAALPQPIVFVVPGIMGSSCRRPRRCGWTCWSWRAAACRGSPRMRRRRGHRPRRSGYAALCAHLSQTHRWCRSPTTGGCRSKVARGRCVRRSTTMPAAGRERRTSRFGCSRTRWAGWSSARCSRPARGRGMGADVPASRRALRDAGNAERRLPRDAAMLMGRDALVQKLALVDLHERRRVAAGDHRRLRRPARPAAARRALDLFDLRPGDGCSEAMRPRPRPVRRRRGLTKSAGFRWTVPATRR